MLKDYKSANQSLEFGLSYNFQIKNHPTYHLIKSRILKQQNQNEEALRTLQLAMQLPGVKKSCKFMLHIKYMILKFLIIKAKSSSDITIQDRVAVYLELADNYLLNKQQHEATKIMQDAINEFHGTSEETRVTIANVDLSLNRGDIDGALSMLKRIDSNQPYYTQAREKMAQIYLKNRKDKKLYISTFK
jgi:tetratricopeptide repeat protein 21B